MNNDKLKFRVFDRETGRYSTDNNWCIKPDGTLQTLYLDEVWSGDMSDRWKVEQCTGLKDLNGKLIYVGDIVKGDEDSFEVLPQKYGFAFRDSFGWVRHRLPEKENIAIIGNIHENPELINTHENTEFMNQ